MDEPGIKSTEALQQSISVFVRIYLNCNIRHVKGSRLQTFKLTSTLDRTADG